MGDLSKNFSISEIFGANKPDEKQALTAKRLAICILQPIRNKLGIPIKIGSGYRTPERNAKIGGSKTSEHTWQDGAGAVDISIFNIEDRINIFEWLANNHNYAIGQCIYYLETSHLHISIANTKQSEFMVCKSKKNHTYVRVNGADDIRKLDPRVKNVS